MHADRAIRALLVGSNDASLPDLTIDPHARTGVVVVGRAEGGSEAAATACELSPDVVLVLADGAVQEPDVLNTIRILAEIRSFTKVFLITRSAVRYLVPAIKAGAAGILSPEANLGELLPALCRTDQRVAFPLRAGSDA